MRLCNVQLQPQRAPSLAIPQIRRVMGAVTRVAGAARSLHMIAGYDRGPYLNFTYATDDPAKLWSAIQSKILGDRGVGSRIAAASIITCQGDRGWDNYLLLHHFDHRVKVDDDDF